MANSLQGKHPPNTTDKPQWLCDHCGKDFPCKCKEDWSRTYLLPGERP